MGQDDRELNVVAHPHFKNKHVHVNRASEQVRHPRQYQGHHRKVDENREVNQEKHP